VHTGETVYDYCWFSGMSAADPASCCFASTSRVSSNFCLTFTCVSAAESLTGCEQGVFAVRSCSLQCSPNPHLSRTALCGLRFLCACLSAVMCLTCTGPTNAPVGRLHRCTAWQL
jgi:hypothetical protein